MTGAPLVPAAIRRWALERGDATAVIDGQEALTYRELWLRAGGWAGALRPVLGGEGPDRVVGTLLPRDARVPAAHLGTWLAGAAYLPLDPTLPPGRVAGIVEDARCSVVIADEQFRDLLPAGVSVISRPGGDEDVERIVCRHDSLAYVIYTSGSTGRPKGVEIEHGSLANLMEWVRAYFRLDVGVQTATLANLGFDGLVFDEWGALSAGATLHVPRQEVLSGLETIVEFLDGQRIDFCYLPTPFFELLLTSGIRPRTVGTIITAGDRLRRWPPADFPAAVYNAYGPTETTVLVTATGDLRAGGDRGRFPPIGRAAAGAQLRIIDGSGAVVRQPSEEGELVIGGPVVGRGYRNAAGLTAQAFVETESYGPGRWYRTGDICRCDSTGQLEFIERRDSQVKVRGYRVELGEIESALLSVAGVQQAIVTTIGEGAPRGVVGWVLGSLDTGRVLESLRRTLPEYMVPLRLTVLDTLPLTSNGKIDRAALTRRGQSE